MKRLKYWLLNIIITELQVGAHCGLCGNWIEHELTYRDWPWSICAKCRAMAEEQEDDSPNPPA